ncbi:MAG: hypothetical protein GY750_14215 [Lentisphaerae bacterium]|nr:hypothetical protein [Lentisphaerota bacterium]MCP4102555.1 hypothetical protein [Lentisphaerota bacterium]
MSWNAEGFDKPMIMLNLSSPEKAMLENAYVPDKDVKKYINEHMTSEQLIHLLRASGMIKEACDYMAFAINRRVGVWWAYSCVKTVNKEIEEQLKKSPLSFEEQQKQEIKQQLAAWQDKSELDTILADYKTAGKDIVKKMEKMSGADIEDTGDPLFEIQAQLKKAIDADNIDFAINEIDAALASMPPAQVKAAGEIVDKTFAAYEKKSGIHPLKVFENDIIESVTPKPIPEDTALRDQYFTGIKSKVEKVRQFAQQKIKEHFPLKISGLPKKISSDKVVEALYAVKRWILTPTDENGQIALELSRDAGQGPEGLCALAAYWSSSDLTPDQKNPITPPPGLASNGILNTIFMCAMKKGGSKTYEERYEEYFNLGVDCLTGVCTWDKEWQKKEGINKGNELLDPLNVTCGFGRDC